MSPIDASLLRYADELAREAGEIALHHFRRRGDLAIERKGALDLVSMADREVERHLRNRIASRFPDDGFLGEEGEATPSASGRTWIVDPIDGTLNFLKGHDAWAVSIGLVADGRPRLGIVHAPVREETLVGGEGLGARLNGDALPPAPDAAGDDAVASIGIAPRIPLDRQLSLIRFLVGESGMSFRRNGCASLSLVMLARQQLDAMLALGVAGWDVVGGLAVAHELGYVSSLAVADATWRGPLDVVCAAPCWFERLRNWEGFTP